MLDGQAAEVRVFASDGTYRRTLGSKGDGPGELRRPAALGRVGEDTVAIFDRRGLRITRFGLDGGVGTITRVVSADDRPVTGAVFLSDGGVVGTSPWTADATGRFTPPAEGEPTFVRDSALLATYGPGGVFRDSLEVMPSAESVWRLARDDASLSLLRRAAVFGRSLVFQAYRERVWYGFNDRFELRLRDAATGRLLRVVRAPGLERDANPAMADAIRERVLAEDEATPERVRWLEAWFALSPRPVTAPAYDRIVVDDRGRLWVREWSGVAPSRRWWVFSERGKLLGSVDAPEGVTVYAVRCGAVWGVERDAFDVSYVVRHSLRGPAIEGEAC